MLVVISDQSNAQSVICKLDNGGGAIVGLPLIGLDVEKDGAQDTA